MEDNYLTISQSTCAARIFLNAFGLILEDFENIDEFSKLKVFDKNKCKVGALHFDNGKVIIAVKSNNYVLDAHYDIAKVSGFIDYESNEAIFCDWYNKIIFEMQNSKNIILYGEFLIDCSIDSELGLKCLCHPLINCIPLQKGDLSIKILRDGQTFGVDIHEGDYKEHIRITPWDSLNGYICHDLQKGEFDKQICKYPYRLYAGIFYGGRSNEDKLHVFLNENKGKDVLSHQNGWVEQVDNPKSSAGLIQKGQLMKKIDPSMYEKIGDLRALLVIDDTFLLDNLFGICYDSYTDEELDALLGIKRNKFKYQDGSSSLIDSYFRIGNKSSFLSIEEQKRLLRK